MEKTIFQTRVEERLQALKLKPAPFAKSLGKSDSFVRDMLRPEKGVVPGGENMLLLARGLKTTADYLLGRTDDPDMGVPIQRFVPIIGLAGAGPDGTVLFAEGHGNFGEIAAPADASEATEALEVRGDSMHGLANDGWIIFYDDKTAPNQDHMGEPCVCWLANGKVLVKVPQPARDSGLFNLESVNAPTMRDIAVDAMALITDIKTRKAAQRFIRRNPDIQVNDVVIG